MLFSTCFGPARLILFITALSFAFAAQSADWMGGARGVMTGPQTAPDKCTEPSQNILAAAAGDTFKTQTDTAGTKPAGGIPVMGNSRFPKLINTISVPSNAAPLVMHMDETMSAMELALKESSVLLPHRKHKVVLLTGDLGAGIHSTVHEFSRRTKQEIIGLNLTIDKPGSILKELEGYTDQSGKRVPGILERAKEKGKEKIIYIDDISLLLQSPEAKTVDLEVQKIRKLLLSGDVQVMVRTSPADATSLKSVVGRSGEQSLTQVIFPRLSGKKLSEVVLAAKKAPEDYFNVEFTPEAIELAIKTSESFDFGSTKFSPVGAALKLLEHVALGMRHAATGNERLLIDEAAFRQGLESSSPFKFMDREKLRGLQKTMNSIVLGQREAVGEIVEEVQTVLRGGWVDRVIKRIGGAYSLMGPSGVGKSFTAETLAEQIDAVVIRLEKADFFGEHGAAIFKGSPKGYVGQGTGGDVLNKVRAAGNRPVIFICDEFEKWPKSARDNFLTMVNDGVASDFDGNVAHFHNTFFMFTMNVAEQEIATLAKAGAPRDQIRHVAHELAKRELGHPFMGRTKTITYNPVDSKVQEEVIDKVWQEVLRVARQNKIDVPIEMGSSVRDWILKSSDQTLGARNTRSTAINTLLDQISMLHFLERPDPALLQQQKIIVTDALSDVPYGLAENVDDLKQIVIQVKDDHFVYRAILNDGTEIWRRKRIPRNFDENGRAAGEVDDPNQLNLEGI